jgi:hypothetical protein
VPVPAPSSEAAVAAVAHLQRVRSVPVPAPSFAAAVAAPSQQAAVVAHLQQVRSVPVPAPSSEAGAVALSAAAEEVEAAAGPAFEPMIESTTQSVSPHTAGQNVGTVEATAPPVLDERF